MNKIINFLEELMEIDAGTLNENMILDDIEEWDSLTKLSLMAACKKEYGKSLTADMIRSFTTVKDICDFIA